MRKKSILVVVIALAGAMTLSITGQEEPLPVVHARAEALQEPTVVLVVEPIRSFETPSLADAARANDFVTFDALYTAAKRRGESVAAFDALHELWSWSMSDPIGAFYGRDTYERFANAYPGFARYIDDYRIVDSRGNVFYPTSETRAFLLARALEGRTTPRVMVAHAQSPLPAAASSRVGEGQGEGSFLARGTSPHPSLRSPLSPRAGRGHSEAAAAVATPVVSTPIVSTSIVVAEPPVVVKAEEPAAASVVAAVDNTFLNRGILLLVIGILGVGLLAVILRTPQELPTTTDSKPPAPVEPFRKTPTPGSLKSEEATKSRATGSHG